MGPVATGRLAGHCLKAGPAALAMRELMGHLRDTGEIQGGGAPFTKKDRSRFLEALEGVIRGVRGKG